MARKVDQLDRIVVPLDGSDVATRALFTAVRLARATSTPVEVMSVVDPDGDRAAIEEHLEQVERTVDVPISARHVFDAYDAAAEIVGFVGDDARTALCMATRGRGPLRESVVGTVAGAVLRSMRREVILTGPRVSQDDVPLRAIHVCVDGSEIADAIVPVAITWARRLGLRANVVHVPAPFADPDTPASLVRPDEDEALRLVRSTTEQFRVAGVDAGWTVSEGSDAADSILETGGRSPSGILALATHGRTGLARMLLGSVAADVLRGSEVPVLVLRPSALLR